MLARIQPFSPLELHHAGSNWASDGLVIPAAGGIGGPKSVTAALVGQAQVLCLEMVYLPLHWVLSAMLTASGCAYLVTLIQTLHPLSLILHPKSPE